MFGTVRNPHKNEVKKQKNNNDNSSWVLNLKPENLIPGIVLGFFFGFISDLVWTPKQTDSDAQDSNSSLPTSRKKKNKKNCVVSTNGDEELKMVLVVRHDLKMGTGKIASQCAHAAVGMYEELVHSQRNLLMQWCQCGQPMIVVKCKNQCEMDKLKEEADNIGLPTFVVADAGRTQVSSGSRTVLAIGPVASPIVRFIRLCPLLSNVETI